MKRVEDYIGASELAIKLSAQGMSQDSIKDELNMKFNSNFTIRQIEGFLKRSKNKVNQILKADKSYQTKVLDSYIDGCSQLKKINSELWKFFYELRKNPEYKDKIITCTHCHKRIILQLQSYGLLLKTAQQILAQIQHSDAVLGKLQKKSLNINYNYCDMSKKISLIMPTLLKKLESQGAIRILQKKFKKIRQEQGYDNKKDQEEDESDDEENKELEDEIEA